MFSNVRTDKIYSFPVSFSDKSPPAFAAVPFRAKTTTAKVLYGSEILDNDGDWQLQCPMSATLNFPYTSSKLRELKSSSDFDLSDEYYLQLKVRHTGRLEPCKKGTISEPL